MFDRDAISSAIALIEQLVEQSDVINRDTIVALLAERNRLKMCLNLHPIHEVHPIDIDFAGWSIVPEGEHNAFGVVNMADNTLVTHFNHRDYTAAVLECGKLNA